MPAGGGQRKGQSAGSAAREGSTPRSRNPETLRRKSTGHGRHGRSNPARKHDHGADGSKPQTKRQPFNPCPPAAGKQTRRGQPANRKSRAGECQRLGEADRSGKKKCDRSREQEGCRKEHTRQPQLARTLHPVFDTGMNQPFACGRKGCRPFLI